MPVIKTDKETIIKKSIHLFKVHGYYKTSMADLAEACGLLKGSIYHYFKGKQDLGLTCLQYIHEIFNESIFSYAYKKSVSPQEQMDGLCKGVEKYFLNSEGGCLLGNWSLEVINDIPEFKEEIRSYFDSWEAALVNILKSKYSEKESHVLAKVSIANIQGALMMMRLYNDKTLFLQENEKTKTLLK